MTVYLISNSANHKVYIGISSKSPKRRWTHHLFKAKQGSQYSLHRAMRKYGVNNFRMEVLATALDAEHLKELEVKFISLHNSKSPLGYNMTNGGDGTKGLTHSKEAKNKIGTFWKGKKKSEETKQKIREAHLGKVLTKEQKAKMAASHLGKKLIRTPEHNRKISEARMGHKHSPLTKVLIGLRHKGKPWSKARRDACK